MTALVTPTGAGSMDETRRVLPDALARALGTVPPTAAGLVSVSIPIEAADPLAWFAAARAASEDVALWLQPATGRSFVGIGAAATFQLAGPDRFRLAADHWRSLLHDRCATGPAAGQAGAGPMLVGGATFAERASTDPWWAGFEHGRLDLPALMFSRAGDGFALTGNLILDRAHDWASTTRALLDRLDRVLAAWPGPAAPPLDDRSPFLRRIGGLPDRTAWSTSVARSAGAVGRGRIDKVVLARSVLVQAPAPIDPTAVLAHLGAPSQVLDTMPVTVFAFDRAGRTFLGASPERLVETQGRRFRTIALAGTTARGTDVTSDADLAAALLASEKDREEHAVVVGMLRETLRPIASRLDIDRTPHICRLPTVQHLASEVSGELRGDHGVLDLVDRLHPTPAVGGWPRAAALELLDEQEQLDRGWYAGPVGWLDATGDGEFVVAIRSGVVAGAQASLFVGCGIVGDSEPDREWIESELKLQSLVSALGRLETDTGASS
jgi:isochorismate synthase